MSDVEVAAPPPGEGGTPKKRSFALPSAYTILFILIVLVAAATWVVPSGTYDYNEFGEPIPGTYHEIDHENAPPLGIPRYLNVASGFATVPYKDGEVPSKAVYNEALRFYHRLRSRLVADEGEAAMLDQIIAHKLQRPREKHPVGLALVGGHGIGKSFFFDIMLKKIIGEQLVKKSSQTDLKSDKRFNGIDRCLFYVIEECKLGELPRETLQILKDAMRNPTIFVDVKWGRIGEVQNKAVPIMLSNEHNPQLIFDGIPDRALCIIKGDRQSDLEMTAKEWETHQAQIKAECAEFAGVLERVELRRALLHHFLDGIDWNVDLITSHNEGRTFDLDIEGGMSPVLTALIAIIREGHIMPLRRVGEQGPSIKDPFMLETLGAGVRERLKDRRVSFDQRLTDNKNIGLAVAELFMETTRTRGRRRSEGIARVRREKVLGMVRYYADATDKPMYYFAARRGELLAMIEERRGIKIVPDYTLEADGERGAAPMPEKAELARWYKYATEQASRQFGFGII